MKKLIFAAGLLSLVAAPVMGAIVFSDSFTPANGNILDNNPSGWLDSRTVSGLDAGLTVTGIQVGLNVSGGWNGDLYGYLQYTPTGGGAGTFLVLLDRVGTTTGGTGYGNTGFSVTLSDAGAHEIENYQSYSPSYNGSGQLTGTWEANNGSTTFASSFGGLSPNGTWSLFMADMSSGDLSQVTGWSLEIQAVPEPTTWALMGFGVLFAGTGVVRLWRRRRTSGFGRLAQMSVGVAALLLASALSSSAIVYSTNWSAGFANGGVVPDDNFSGWSDTRTVGAIPAVTFTSLSVDLQLSGGWNGDLYAYLVHSSGFTVLLDHVGVGVSGVSGFGYGDAGMNVNLAASGTSIHQYGGNSTFSAPPTGSWMTDNTSGSLASFLSTNPNGTWSLFIADMSAGGVATVQNWGLQMDIVAVPEAETWIAAALAGAFGAFWLNRQMWKGVKPPQRG